MKVVLLALAAAALFGATGVATQFGLRRSGDAEAGAFVTLAVGLAACLLAAPVFSQNLDVRLSKIWPYLAIGALVPGASQVIFVRAIQNAGPARALVVMASTPLVSAVIAIAAFGEPFRFPLVIGTVLIVGGAAALAWEGDRPADFRVVGLLFALVCTFLFATRDNLIRSAVHHTHASPVDATAALLAAGSVIILIYLALANPSGLAVRARRTLPAFVPAGILLGFGFDALLSAYQTGRVTVVAPLASTAAIWTVSLSAMFLGRSEAVTRQLLVAAALIVGGAVLIGARH